MLQVPLVLVCVLTCVWGDMFGLKDNDFGFARVDFDTTFFAPGLTCVYHLL